MIKKPTKLAKKKVVKKLVKKIAKKSGKKLTKKKAKSRVAPKERSGSVAKNKTNKEKKIGKLLHYFDKIKVIVVKLSDVLVVGDMIHVKGGKETDFKQKIVSMEIDGEKIKKAKKGQKVGIKVKDKAREGYFVFKL